MAISSRQPLFMGWRSSIDMADTAWHQRLCRSLRSVSPDLELRWTSRIVNPSSISGSLLIRIQSCRTHPQEDLMIQWVVNYLLHLNEPSPCNCGVMHQNDLRGVQKAYTIPPRYWADRVNRTSISVLACVLTIMASYYLRYCWELTMRDS